jgi:hypothetical protein
MTYRRFFLQTTAHEFSATIFLCEEKPGIYPDRYIDLIERCSEVRQKGV